MSILSQAFKAGRLYVWETDTLPKLMDLPEKVYKASVGVDHIVAIGESGYPSFNSATFILSGLAQMENWATGIRRIRSNQN